MANREMHFAATGVQAVRLAAQAASAVAATGVHNWSATISFTIPGHANQQASASGTAAVVARDSSPYGAGWGIGIAQLVAVTGGVLWVTGAGDSRFFASAGGGAFTSPAEDFGTLVQNGVTVRRIAFLTGMV